MISGLRSDGIDTFIRVAAHPETPSVTNTAAPTEIRVMAGAANEPNVSATIVSTARTVNTSTMWT